MTPMNHNLAPVGYLPEMLLFENGIVSDVSLSGIKSVSTAIDTAGTQWYFMLDAAKNRIIRLNAQFELYAVYDYFCDAAGNKLNISNAVNIRVLSSRQKQILNCIYRQRNCYRCFRKVFFFGALP